MTAAQIRQAAPIVYGGIVAVLWLTVRGTPAMLFTVIGGICLGLMYTLGPRDCGTDT